MNKRKSIEKKPDTKPNPKEQSRDNLEKAKKQDKAIPLHGEEIGGA